jgi:hypothetical protein
MLGEGRSSTYMVGGFGHVWVKWVAACRSLPYDQMEGEKRAEKKVLVRVNEELALWRMFARVID